MSASGRYVVFDSAAPNLVDNDLNGACDVFVRDRQERTTERVSVSSLGLEAPGADPTGRALSCPNPAIPASYEPTISAAGRYVVFTSIATTLVPGDTNLACDVFLRDLKKGSTERISVASDGSQAEPALTPGVAWPNSDHPSISRSGRYVVFSSAASDLVDNDTNEDTDVFLRDLSEQTTTRLSVGMGGAEANGTSAKPFISANGRYVVFHSDAANLTPGGGGPQVYLFDRETKKTELISVNVNGERSSPSSRVLEGAGRVISDDGRFVIFLSNDPKIVPNDGNGVPGVAGYNDIFVRDRKTRRTERVSVRTDGGEPNHNSWGMAISADGRYVTMTSIATNLDPGDTYDGVGSQTTSDPDAFVHDRWTGALEWISVDPSGGEPRKCEFSAGGDDVTVGATSDNGRYVAFWSCYTNIVEGDTNEEFDLFLRDRGVPLGTIQRPDETRQGAGSPRGALCIDESCLTPFDMLDAADSLTDPRSASGEHDLIGARIAYRPDLRDLFVSIEIEEMPVVAPGLSPFLYGLRFNVGGSRYEVRATSLLGGTFGLFDCSGLLPTCIKVADLHGGYGTTGERIVFALPLEALGLEAGGDLSEVEAFSSIGLFHSGETNVLDTITFD